MSTTINTVTDEQFAEVYASDENKSKLLISERSIMSLVFGACGCVLGTHSYSTGIHSIRIKVHGGHPIIGIRSRNITPKPDELRRGSYGVDRSTYGWEKDYGRVLNGVLYRRRFQDLKIDRVNTVYTLILDCDKHRLNLIEENGEEDEEVEVDISCAPLPWCLFIAVNQGKTHVSLI